ncbi:protein D1-like [Planococcus citri]|uniref:protein D1-like n=1 Tax=Planococcus citri TaxID=170843 RepID=UPI0031F8FFEB
MLKKSLLIGFLIIATLHLIYGGIYEDYYYLKEKLTEMKVIGEIIPCSTKYFANVSWPSGATATLGNILSPSEVREKPTVVWPYNPKKQYLVLFTDMDDVYNADPIMKEFQLWFVYDIPGIDMSKGKEEYQYILPDFRNKYHRVSVIVMQQREQVNMSQSIFGVGARHNWTALELMYEFGGSLHAANVFVVKPE